MLACQGDENPNSPHSLGIAHLSPTHFRVILVTEDIKYDLDFYDSQEFMSFLQDLCSAFLYIGNMTSRLGLAVSCTTASNNIYYNTLDTPMHLSLRELNLLIWNKPRSFDKLPVTIQVHTRHLAVLNIRTTSESLVSFGQQLSTIIRCDF